MFRERAYNRLTGEQMYKPEFPRYSEYEHVSEWLPAYYTYISSMKLYQAFEASCPPRWVWEPSKMVHAKQKGIPIKGTGNRRWRSGENKGKSGVIASSHVVPHRYMHEGDKGKWLRREIKRKERMYVRQEIAEGFADWLYPPDVFDEYDVA